MMLWVIRRVPGRWGHHSVWLIDGVWWFVRVPGLGVQNGLFPWALGGFLGVGGSVDRVDA